MSVNSNLSTPAEPRDIQASIALALPLAFAAGLAVAGLTLLLALKIGIGDVLLDAAGVDRTAEQGLSADAKPVAERDTPVAERTTPAGIPASSPALQRELEHLRQTLMTAEEERKQLAARLETLELEWREAPQRSDDQAGTSIGSLSVESAIQQALRESLDEAAAAPQASEFESLVAAGIDAVTADELQSRVDRFKLERLELYDQASREGWLDSEEFVERLDTLEEQRVDLRGELGDEAFDRYLFASGRANRVNVVSVLGGSVAENAGVQSGDIILAYAEERIFTLPDLQRATRGGERGESVTMALARGEERLIVTVPRGPLGVTLNGKRESPTSAP